MELATLVYTESGRLPKEEKFNLTDQMRCAAISIPSNIAEGSARFSNKEYLQFLNYAMGSIMELETQSLLCKELEFDFDHKEVLKKINEVRRQLFGLQRYLKSRSDEVSTIIQKEKDSSGEA